MFKRTKFYSIFHNKCPKCHQGDFFIQSNPYKLKEFDKMHTECNVCKESFEREPGFYYGAMYINYGITVAIGVAWFLINYILFDFNALFYSISFAVILILLLPVVFRLGRLVWINLFVKYNPDNKLKN